MNNVTEAKLSHSFTPSPAAAKTARLAGGVVAGLAAVAAVASAQHAGAVIVYTPASSAVDVQHPTADVNFTSPTSNEVQIGYNPANGPSPGLSMFKTGNISSPTVSYVPGANVVTAQALAAGEVIDGTNTTASLFGASAILNNGQGKGEFTTAVGTRYIGVSFLEGKMTNPDYGWIGFHVINDSSSAALQGAITGYAYQNDGSGIAAGDTGAGALPEPCTMALLVLGVAGIAAKKRRALR